MNYSLKYGKISEKAYQRFLKLELAKDPGKD